MAALCREAEVRNLQSRMATNGHERNFQNYEVPHVQPRMCWTLGQVTAGEGLCLVARYMEQLGNIFYPLYLRRAMIQRN